ncbi:hypothetical protein HY634_00755 [Candidatus Uhrbacteria bacterium]|nr:hypothetical protein [Candidatus Uhrbacteria bacterium]
MRIFVITLRVLLAIVFVALCAVTAISIAPFGAVAVFLLREGWIGTGLFVLISIVLNMWLLLWMVGLFQAPPEPCTVPAPRQPITRPIGGHNGNT